MSRHTTPCIVTPHDMTSHNIKSPHLTPRIILYPTQQQPCTRCDIGAIACNNCSIVAHDKPRCREMSAAGACDMVHWRMGMMRVSCDDGMSFIRSFIPSV